MGRRGERGRGGAASRLPSAGSASGAFVAIAVVFWLFVGLLAGTQEYLVARSSSWSGHLAAPLKASAIWVPLTIGVAALSRRFPMVPFRGSRLLVHAVGSLLVGLVLNLAYFLAEGATGAAFIGDATRAAVRWLHINAGAYWAIVAAAHWTDLRAGEAQRSAAGQPGAHSIRVRTGRRVELVPLEDIVWIEGADDYARVHAEDREHLVSRRLKDLEAELPGDAFLRVHRSALVRLDRIRELQHRSHGDYAAVMDTGARVRVSRRRREALMQRLEAVGV